jgi:hypothetical protein
MEVLCVPSLAAAVEGHDRVDLLDGTEMERFYQASAADSIINGLGDRSISLSLHVVSVLYWLLLYTNYHNYQVIDHSSFSSNFN